MPTEDILNVQERIGSISLEIIKESETHCLVTAVSDYESTVIQGSYSLPRLELLKQYLRENIAKNALQNAAIFLPPEA